METKLHNLLAQSVTEILWQAVKLLADITDAHYNCGNEAARSNGGTLGGHFRHCLEFVNCFLAGAETGKIDYNRRQRDQLVETDRRHAAAEFLRALNRLEKLAATATAGSSLLVKPEDIIEPNGADFWCASSLERELEFMQSHTIHHYALIAFKLRQMNFHVPPEFGVAPSTLRFWAAEQKRANAAIAA